MTEEITEEMTEEIEFLGNIIEVSDNKITFIPHCLHCGKNLTEEESKTLDEAKDSIRNKLWICSYKCLGQYVKEYYIEHYIHFKNLLGKIPPSNHDIGKAFYKMMQENKH